MENEITKFNITKADLTELADKYSGLTVNGIEDEAGYKKLVSATKELQSIRLNIQRIGKELRSDAVKKQKSVIADEKELISCIAPTESELNEKIAEIDGLLDMEKRRKVLPERLERLKEYGITMEEDDILRMDGNRFDFHINSLRANILAEKEQKIQEKKIKEFLVKNNYRNDGTIKTEKVQTDDGAKIIFFKKVGEIKL